MENLLVKVSSLSRREKDVLRSLGLID